MTAPLLRIDRLEKRLPNGRVLYASLDLAIADGEFVAIMGESGVGKSTLLNIVAGLDRIDAGSVRFDDIDLASLDDDALTRLRRDRMGFVFQAFHVLPHLTVAQNVALPLLLQQQGHSDVDARATAMLDAVGLGGRGGDFPTVLSGGELQRVAIARALIHRPALLLLDEPTGNLDPETAERILETIDVQRRDSGSATLLVTHSEVAAARADRVLTLRATGLVPRVDARAGGAPDAEMRAARDTPSMEASAPPSGRIS